MQLKQWISQSRRLTPLCPRLAASNGVNAPSRRPPLELCCSNYHFTESLDQVKIQKMPALTVSESELLNSTYLTRRNLLTSGSNPSMSIFYLPFLKCSSAVAFYLVHNNANEEKQKPVGKAGKKRGYCSFSHRVCAGYARFIRFRPTRSISAMLVMYC